MLDSSVSDKCGIFNKSVFKSYRTTIISAIAYKFTAIEYNIVHAFKEINSSTIFGCIVNETAVECDVMWSLPVVYTSTCFVSGVVNEVTSKHAVTWYTLEGYRTAITVNRIK